jgi:FolB domain-containing protein
VATISLRDLVVNGRHGVDEHEKTTEQPFKISLELDYDASAAQQSDNIDDAVDYASVRQTVISVVQDSSFNLLERLAQAIGDKLLEDSRVSKATITIEKLTIFETGVPGMTITISRQK